jgi:putative hydrolase of the HAD superfamily
MQAPVSSPRVLMLDAMGTLLRLRPPAPLLRRELAERFGLEITLPEAERAIAAEIRYYRAHMLEGRDAPSVRRLRAACAEVLRAELGPQTPELTAALLASLRFDPFPDVRPALAEARALGWRVIVVSNWDASLAEVLRGAGLAEHLDVVLTSAEVGTAKPEAAIFRAALDAAGVSADSAVHVGDHLEEDVAGARAVGIRALWLNRSADPAPAGVEAIAGLDQLRRTLG